MNCSPLLNKRNVTKSIVWLFHYSVKELPGSLKGNESFILWLSGMHHYYGAVILVKFDSNFQYNLKNKQEESSPLGICKLYSNNSFTLGRAQAFLAECKETFSRVLRVKTSFLFFYFTMLFDWYRELVPVSQSLSFLRAFTSFLVLTLSSDWFPTKFLPKESTLPWYQSNYGLNLKTPQQWASLSLAIKRLTWSLLLVLVFFFVFVRFLIFALRFLFVLVLLALLWRAWWLWLHFTNGISQQL